MATTNVLNLAKEEELYSLLQDNPEATILIFFSASWSPQCQQMGPLFDELVKKYPTLRFVKVEAEDFEEVAESYEVAAVPAFVFVRKLAIVDRVDGANAPELSRLAEKHARGQGSASTQFPSAQAAATPSNVTATTSAGFKQDLNTRLKELTHRAPVMAFIKGTPAQPRCGFSKTLVGLLSDHGIKFGYFDILTDDDVRQGLKAYSNWPTYPQLYIDGELTGGLDIIKEMIDSGELMETVPASARN
ncbi:glutaredoxin [Tieghemiomyces parasiticus]|uniref:Glutaredoxin n=1 Tax=Tieghemiomyces parasiticus TaxID=78921 RepID=A0A9W8E1J1_9FUNG|nr:glutaredoxin [Tieghemiomyces parasiticus]